MPVISAPAIAPGEEWGEGDPTPALPVSGEGAGGHLLFLSPPACGGIKGGSSLNANTRVPFRTQAGQRAGMPGSEFTRT